MRDESVAGPPVEVARTVTTDRPGADPQPVAVPLRPWQIVLTRAVRTAIQAFLPAVGMVIISPDTVLAPGVEGKVLSALIFSLAVGMMSALQNTAELLGNLDKSNPELRA